MKTITEYIFESKLSDMVFCEQFSIMFKGTKMTRDMIETILSNLDADFVMKLSKYFVDNDNINYLAYDPGDDMFINYAENKTKIISQIAEYLLKYRVQ
jgi:hypothetical protein